MGAIKREPTPVGQVSDLFDRLHDLHLKAGQPSLRQIATKIGRGVVSSSTVHNMFRGPRVPKWGFLELVVEELGGNVAEFRGLWQAARLAEEAADNPRMTGTEGNGGSVVPTESGALANSPLLAAPTGPVAPGTPHRIWSNENPQRNLHFTGRVAELDALRANLTRDDRPHPAAQLISGMGGVGKTEIATEYIHRHRDKYEIIWWIRAEHTDRVRDALVKLGQRLGVRSGRHRERPRPDDCGRPGNPGVRQPAELAPHLRQRSSAARTPTISTRLPAGWPHHHYLAAPELARVHRKGQCRGFAFHRGRGHQLPAPPGTGPRHQPEAPSGRGRAAHRRGGTAGRGTGSSAHSHRARRRLPDRDRP